MPRPDTTATGIFAISGARRGGTRGSIVAADGSGTSGESVPSKSSASSGFLRRASTSRPSPAED
jgi:hypothetical protein